MTGRTAVGAVTSRLSVKDGPLSAQSAISGARAHQLAADEPPEPRLMRRLSPAPNESDSIHQGTAVRRHLIDASGSLRK